METYDPLGAPIKGIPDEALLHGLINDFDNNALKVSNIASYMQTLLDLLFHSDKFWMYAEEKGYWVEAEEYIINNRIGDFLSEHCPTKADNRRIQDIRRRLFDIVHELHRFDLDKHPNLRQWLNFRNGLYNFHTGLFMEHMRESFSFYQFPTEFDKDALCPNWNEFLAFATNGDNRVKDLIQNFIGLVLSDRLDIQKYLHIIGIPGTGKSRFVSAIQRIIGFEFCANVDFGDERDSFPFDQILGKKLLIVDEFEVSRLSPEMEKNLKILGSFGPLRVKRKYKDAQSIRSKAKLIICSNNFPAISDASNAIFRRLMLIRFDNVISLANQIKWFSETNEFETELPGIINWCLEGLKRIESIGGAAFELPPQCVSWITDIKAEASQIIRWATDNCEFSSPDPLMFTSTKILFENYNKWADEESIQRMYKLTRDGFSKKIKQAFYGKVIPHSNGNERGYLGISLKMKSIF